MAAGMGLAVVPAEPPQRPSAEGQRWALPRAESHLRAHPAPRAGLALLPAGLRLPAALPLAQVAPRLVPTALPLAQVALRLGRAPRRRPAEHRRPHPPRRR